GGRGLGVVRAFVVVLLVVLIFVWLLGVELLFDGLSSDQSLGHGLHLCGRSYGGTGGFQPRPGHIPMTACHGPTTTMAEAIDLALPLFHCRCAAETELESDARNLVVRHPVGDRLVDEGVGVVPSSTSLLGRSPFTFERDTQVGYVSAIVHDERDRARYDCSKQIGGTTL